MDRLKNKRNALLILLMVAGVMMGYAQSQPNYFTYDGEGNTIITGLTDDGKNALRLVIPSEVIKVRSGAFSNASSGLSTLIIDGGNPTFEDNLFGSGGSRTLASIDMGNKMTVANMVALLTSIGAGSINGSVRASGFTRGDDDDNPTWSNVNWTGATFVTLPAELVPAQSVQQFGNAAVYGHFTIDKEIISFCTSATFEDVDNGSNMLFYVADECDKANGYIHIQRVHYVGANKGVLIHRTQNSYGYCDLPRVNGIPSGATTDNSRYGSNMLVGVTTPTTIGAEDGNKTNYVLKDGAFHPTSGGTIGANKAYLQIPTAQSRGIALEISFPDEETGIKDIHDLLVDDLRFDTDSWYTLDGRMLDMKPTTKGLYINNGKKYVIR